LAGVGKASSTAPLIAKQKKGSGFRGLLNYVEGKEGARRIGGNMVGRNARELAAEFKFSWKLSARVKKPVYHVSMSVPKGTELDDETWNVLARDYLEEMGFTANQYAVYRHTDREHDHIHIVASRVRLDSGKTVDDAWDFVTSKKVLNELAKTHGLAPLETSFNEPDRRAPTTGQKRRVMREIEEYEEGKRDKPPEPTVLEQLQDAIDKASLDKPIMPELIERLKDQGVDARVQFQSTGRINGISYALNGVKFAGKKLGRAYTFPGLQKYRGISYESERDDDLIKELNLRPPVSLQSKKQHQEHPTEERQEKPFKPILKISEEQREKAEQIYPIAWSIFLQATRQGKAQEETPGTWSYKGQNYALYYIQESASFSISNKDRGELARYEAGLLQSAQAIQQQDLETLQRHDEAQQQIKLLERQKQEQLKQQATLPKKDIDYER
jgi:hypothetical protein